MRTLAILITLGALLVAAPARARADDDVVTYATDGAATASRTDARTVALDDAFKAATRAALDQLVTGANLASQRDVLDAEVVRRARLWVASFKVTAERTRGGSLELEVDVRIDRAKLRAKLDELGVPMVAGEPARRPDAGAVAARMGTVLLRLSTGDGAVASYGADADTRLPLVMAVAPILATRGLVAVAAPAGGAKVRAGTGLPLDDAGARALAGEVHADVAVVVGVDVGASGRVRGTREVGVLARARVRVLDLGAARATGEADAVRGARGPGGATLGTDAARWALLDAVSRAMPMVRQAAAATAEPALPVAAGEVVVRIHAAGRDVATRARAYLADAQGVKSARLARFGAGAVVLTVTGLRAERIATLLRGATELGLAAKVVDDEVVATDGAR